MSTLKVDKLRSLTDSAVEFSKGVSVATASTITGNITCGVCTAGFFSGSAAGLTNLPGATVGYAVAQNITSI